MKSSFAQGRLAALSLVLLLPLTACGGNDEAGDPAPRSAAPPSTAAPATPSPSPSASDSPAPTSAPPTAIRTLTDCLRKQGIEVPSSGEQWTPPPGYDPTKAQKALKACLQQQTGGD